MHKEYILLNGFRKAKKNFSAGFHVPLIFLQWIDCACFIFSNGSLLLLSYSFMHKLRLLSFFYINQPFHIFLSRSVAFFVIHTSPVILPNVTTALSHKLVQQYNI